MNNKSVVRMEKRAVNKIGLVLIILLAIAALGGGVYFLYKNHDNLDFSFPWSKSSKEKKEEKKEAKEQEKIALERQKIDISDNKPSTIDSIEITPLGIKYDEDGGYRIALKFTNRLPYNQEMEIYNIAIDGYQIDYYEEVKIGASATYYHDIFIKKESLDLYNIETFKNIYIYNRSFKEGAERKKKDFTKLVITNNEFGENTQAPKIISNVGNADQLKIDYYKREDTVDYYNIYFLATNSIRSNKGYYTMIINAFKVNDTILTNNDFKEDIYDGNKKIVILSIPKSKFKSLDSLTISFFVLHGDDIYTTKTTTLTFNK